MELVFTAGWALKEALDTVTEREAELRVSISSLRGVFAAWRGVLFGMAAEQWSGASMVDGLLSHTAHRRSYASVGISLSAAGAPRFVKVAVVSAAPPVPALGS